MQVKLTKCLLIYFLIQQCVALRDLPNLTSECKNNEEDPYQVTNQLNCVQQSFLSSTYPDISSLNILPIEDQSKTRLIIIGSEAMPHLSQSVTTSVPTISTDASTITNYQHVDPSASTTTTTTP
jgi:hypothetical protein